MDLDEALVAKILLSDRVRLSAAVWAVVRDTHLADDIFQETVVKAISDPSRFQDAKHVSRWGMTTARNLAIDAARHSQRTKAILQELALQRLDDFWVTQSPQKIAEWIDVLHECIEKLPDRSRQMVRLRYEDGLPGESVARLTRRSLAAVYKNLSRVHEQLRECVERTLAIREREEGSP